MQYEKTKNDKIVRISAVSNKRVTDEWFAGMAQFLAMDYQPPGIVKTGVMEFETWDQFILIYYEVDTTI